MLFLHDAVQVLDFDADPLFENLQILDLQQHLEPRGAADQTLVELIGFTGELPHGFSENIDNLYEFNLSVQSVFAGTAEEVFTCGNTGTGHGLQRSGLQRGAFA